jgi:hypothetical protein
MRVFGAGLAIWAVALAPAWAEAPSQADLVAAADPGFAPGTYGESFTVTGTNEGCYDDEGMIGCSLLHEGRRYVTYEGSVTPVVILDLMTKVAVGELLELSGDAYATSDTRVEAVFSSLRLVQ